MNSKKFAELLQELNACSEARKWASGKSLAIVWKTCKRGDWLLWLCGKMADKEGWPTHKEVVLAACDCAELALKHVPAGEERPRKCIEVVRAWAAGNATRDEVRMARRVYAAYAYADAAAAYAANAAAAAVDTYYAAADAYAADAYADAYAAAAAAANANAAAYAAAAAAYAATDARAADAYAYAAHAAAHAAAHDAARAKTLAKCATLVRKRLKIGRGV